MKPILLVYVLIYKDTLEYRYFRVHFIFFAQKVFIGNEKDFNPVSKNGVI